MELRSFKKTGKLSTEKTKVEDGIFADKVNINLLKQIVYVQLSNKRTANAHTKTRGDVSGGGKKPWKQKGTGRARHGSNRSPIWKGGGVTFGPTNERNYKKSINKYMRKAGYRSAFTMKTQEESVYVIENFDVTKTKQMKEIVKNLGLKGSVMIVQKEDKGLHKASSNIENVYMMRIGELSVYDILKAKNIVLMEETLPIISENWSKK